MLFSVCMSSIMSVAVRFFRENSLTGFRWKKTFSKKGANLKYTDARVYASWALHFTSCKCSLFMSRNMWVVANSCNTFKENDCTCFRWKMIFEWKNGITQNKLMLDYMVLAAVHFPHLALYACQVTLPLFPLRSLCMCVIKIVTFKGGHQIR